MGRFDNIILTGRPASGKSEFVDFFKKMPKEERLERFHIGDFEELDDFLWVWELGEHDDIWEKMGRERLYTKNVGHGYVTKEPELVLTKFMTLKMNRELMSRGDSQKTLFIEFARGGREGFKYTLNNFDSRILQKAAVLFLNNSFEECIRRNEARYQEKKKHSILAHKVPDEEMYGIYKTHDWLELTAGRPNGYLTVKGVSVPYVTMVNEPELPPGPEIAARYKNSLDTLLNLTNRTSSYL